MPSDFQDDGASFRVRRAAFLTPKYGPLINPPRRWPLSLLDNWLGRHSALYFIALPFRIVFWTVAGLIAYIVLCHFLHVPGF